MPIRFLDMFAGIGGFRSGLERLGGFECVGYCEIDKYAKQAYDAMYPTKGELYFADARTIDPCRTLKIAAAPAVVRIVAAVGVASLLGIAFEVFFLIHDGIAIPGVVIIAGQPLIESGNFAFSLFHAHDALLSDCRLICGASIISQVPSFVTISLRTIRKILSSMVSPPLSLNTTLTL